MPMNSEGPHEISEGRDEALAAAAPVQGVGPLFTPLDDGCHVTPNERRSWEGTT